MDAVAANSNKIVFFYFYVVVDCVELKYSALQEMASTTPCIIETARTANKNMLLLARSLEALSECE